MPIISCGFFFDLWADFLDFLLFTVVWKVEKYGSRLDPYTSWPKFYPLLKKCEARSDQSPRSQTESNLLFLQFRLSRRQIIPRSMTGRERKLALSAAGCYNLGRWETSRHDPWLSRLAIFFTRIAFHWINGTIMGRIEGGAGFTSSQHCEGWQRVRVQLFFSSCFTSTTSQEESICSYLVVSNFSSRSSPNKSWHLIYSFAETLIQRFALSYLLFESCPLLA